jgi:anti-sigma regulatory factor (Ser/Thr protein kinase)
MEDLSLHVLDIAENSIEAGATKVNILITESPEKDLLQIEVADNGKGMNRDVLARVADPFFTTRKKKKSFGLGIPLLKQSAEESGGGLSINSKPGKGTVLKASFKLSHVDLKPTGDMGSTIATLIAGHPEIEYSFSYKKNGFSYSLDTKEVKKALGDVPVNIPPVLKLIKDEVNEAMWRKDLHGK